MAPAFPISLWTCCTLPGHRNRNRNTTLSAEIDGCHPAPRRLVDTRQLLPLLRQQDGGGCELLLIQASASYFAAEPVLKALKEKTSLGVVEKYIVPPPEGEEMPHLELPRYLDSPEVRFDLWTPLHSEQKTKELTGEERRR